MDEKIMSRVLVGFDETTDFRGRTDARGDGHEFFEKRELLEMSIGSKRLRASIDTDVRFK